jgi:TfoX/Sxy family transcriptional regulator of competence genes
VATRQDIVDFLLEQLSGVPDVTARKMFGEYAIYSTGKVVALVCDDQLFVKPSDAGRKFIGRVTEGEPYPGAKACFLVEGDQWEDGDWLSELIRVTAKALPMPKAKTAPRRSARALAATKNAETKASKTKGAVKTPGKVKSKGGVRSRA